ncbi:MAG: DUF4252 domain-containing protein [Bacteroidales bacterium]|nr:DUF4252 domain-containing protein [Bacteroidales bacterium]
MKKTVLKISLIILMIIPSVLFAQKSPMSKLFDKYNEKDGYTSVVITTDAIKINPGNDKDAIEYKELLDQVGSIKIIKSENIEFYNKVMKVVKKNDYEQVIDIRESGEEIGFYMLIDKKGNLNEYLLAVKDENEIIVILVLGDIDFNKVMEMTKMVKSKKR